MNSAKKAKIVHVTSEMTTRWQLPGYTKANTKLDIETAYEYERDSSIAAWMVEVNRQEVADAARHLSLSVPMVATMLYWADEV